MSIYTGSNINIDGLIMLVDPDNRRSYVGGGCTDSLINTSTWTVGTGPVTGYPVNGSNSESERLSATNPWGTSDIVWQTNPLGDNNADGGWEGSYFTIDNTRLYRYCVWVRRISSTTSGTFYMGLHTNGTGDTFNLSDGTSQTNPYWSILGLGTLVQNTWYLFVGHLYPHTHTGTTANPASGYYTVAGGTTKIGGNTGNIPSDVKFPSNATQAMQRVYHYYCLDTTSKLQFAYPRVDLIDGNEPTIAELLSMDPAKVYDSSGNANHLTLVNRPLATNGVMRFSPTSYAFNTLNRATGTTTVIGAARYSGATRQRIISANSNNWLMGQYAGATENYYAEGWVIGGSNGAADTNWRVYAATSNTVADSYAIYSNGVVVASNANGSAGPNGIHINGYGPSGTERSDGELGYLSVYNRVLSGSEINQIFSALRGRYSI